MISDTAIFAIYWFAIGSVCTCPFVAAITAYTMRDRSAKRRQAEASAIHRDLFGSINRSIAARHAAVAGFDWPPLPSDDAMHGSAS